MSCSGGRGRGSGAHLSYCSRKSWGVQSDPLQDHPASVAVRPHRPALWQLHRAFSASAHREVLAAVRFADAVEGEQRARVEAHATALHRLVQLDHALERARRELVELARLQRRREVRIRRTDAARVHLVEKVEDARGIARAALDGHHVGERVRRGLGEGGEVVGALLHLVKYALRRGAAGAGARTARGGAV
eukprot:3406399-Prymnesium_polylepis.1